MIPVSLPNLETDITDTDIEEDGLVHYVVRVTPYEKFAYEDFVAYIHEEQKIAKYVISREVDAENKLHFHAVVSVDESVTPVQIRDIIKNYLIRFWENPDTHKFVRGFGSKQYHMALADNIDSAISYAVKDGKYVYDCWDEEYIKERAGLSFTKKSPNDFKKEYDAMCEAWQNSTDSVRDFMISFGKLKSKYGQMINLHHAKAFALSNLCKRDPEAYVREVDNFLRYN